MRVKSGLKEDEGKSKEGEHRQTESPKSKEEMREKTEGMLCKVRDS